MARSAHMQVVRTAMVRGVAAALLAAAPASLLWRRRHEPVPEPFLQHPQVRCACN